MSAWNFETARVFSAAAPGATPAYSTDTADVIVFTGLAAAITSMTSGLTGTPNLYDVIEFRLTDNGTIRAITWGASFLASGTQALLTTTAANKQHVVKFQWDGTHWVCFYVDATGY